MKVALVQMDIAWGDPDANQKKLDFLLKGLEHKLDLCILPEMFSTGFITMPEGIAEQSPSGSLSWLQEKASAFDCAFATSIALYENGKYYNRFHFVKPDGEVSVSDKHHLFTFGGEHNRFTRGNNRVVVSWRGVRFLINVCYDLRFPVWSRNRKDYDVALYVASWPSVRRYPWDTLLRARAIENQCFVAGVNRVGSDPSCVYDGGTVLVGPYGDVLAKAGDSKEEVVVADIDMEDLEAFRIKFPVLEDADDFEIVNMK